MRYSVLIPHRNLAPALQGQLGQLCRVLRQLAGEHELICIDDSSTPEQFAAVQDLLPAHPALRLLRLDHPQGTSAALTAGLEAARGEVIVAVSAGCEYRADQIPQLLENLARADVVFGRRGRGPLAKMVHRVARIPRWFLLGLDVRDPDCLFWAARREAVVGLQLGRGMCRFLAPLVVMRGFRVTEVAVESQGRRQSAGDGRRSLGNLLAVWWLRHHCPQQRAREVGPAGEDILPFAPDPRENEPALDSRKSA